MSSAAQSVCAVPDLASGGLSQRIRVPKPAHLLPAAEYSLPQRAHSVRQSSATMLDAGQPREPVLYSGHSADPHPNANLHPNQPGY
jgi:hypothetical protein